MKTLILMLITVGLALSSQASEQNQKKRDYALPVLQNWLTYNSEVVEVCVFREQWVAPTKGFPKGQLLKYATITYVHKGSVKVGDRVILTSLIEYPRAEWKREAKLRPDRVSMVDGELMVAMFNKKDAPYKDGYWSIAADICRFAFNSDFHHAFLIEKKREPKLIGIQN